MKNMKFLSKLICLSVSLMIVSIITGARVRPLSIIYPGEGIGNIRFENTLAEVISVLGWEKADQIKKDKEGREFYFIYKRRGVILVFIINVDNTEKKLSEAILTKITITSPAFMVAESGIRVGDKKIDVENYYLKKLFFKKQNLPLDKGIAECKEEKNDIICDGIKFVVSKKADIVEAIEIFPPLKH